MTRDMNWKIRQNAGDGRCWNFGLKLNVHVQYNMLRWYGPLLSPNLPEKWGWKFIKIRPAMPNFQAISAYDPEFR